MREFKGTAKTNHEVIVAALWENGGWMATHELVKLDRPYGFVGNAGDVRARELARNECAEHLKDKVERARGGEIGLDRRFEYFRYKQARFDNAALLRFFDEYPAPPPTTI